MPITIFGITVAAATLTHVIKITVMDLEKKWKEHKDRLAREAKEASITSRSIYVLGLKGAGKTSLLLKMGAVLPDTTTNGTIRIETYQSFKTKVKGEYAIIKAGEDIGGGESFITTDKYKEESDLQRIVKTRDIILYLFDVNEFIRDPEGYNKYREENLSRIKYIFDVAKDENKIQSIKLFATHKNSFVNNGGNIEDIIDHIKDMARDYDSEPLFAELKVVDTQNDKDVHIVKKSIFS